MGAKVSGVIVLEGTLDLSPSSLRQDSSANSSLGGWPREYRESKEEDRKTQTRGSLQTGQHGELPESLWGLLRNSEVSYLKSNTTSHHM